MSQTTWTDNVSRAQRLILKAAAKDPRGNCPTMIEGVTRSVAWVRYETLEKLQGMGYVDNVRDLSDEERAHKDLVTIATTRQALALMLADRWPDAHDQLRQLVELTELRHAQVWRISAAGRAAVAKRFKRDLIKEA